MISPKIRNIICTSDLKQIIDISKFINFPWGIYDEVTYGGRCGYVKTPDIKGKVTIFLSGKMISLGANSLKTSYQQLETAKFCLSIRV